ncbi:Sugar kinase of the NBD/HSP70 family, may contain an N-terminal HTH domain [Haloechinothrix alba]|uniref:Sugar kinase of the NBD/HSP70 family, may contain an N-terminal HTH domain n=1 Tax=Haloechinothrix alba TaxID=664784 RepID=A0A238Z4E0_9PSEU|nr:ROK family transcriptional regulator [Haloechinothrix alba]SNR78237.1 Sugar kinase of the NBD/HSP70 family, may contain an N-terminal HTH domain [Haloechinothrix alba]
MRRATAAPSAPSSGDVFQLIRNGAAQTRSELGRLTGLSRTAVTLRVEQLLATGLVTERPDGGSTGGRPPVRLAFDAGGGTVLAVALGGSRAQVAVCDLAATVKVLRTLPVDLADGPEAVLDAVATELADLMKESGGDPGQVWGIGASIPGAIDVGTGRSLSPPVLPGWGDVPIVEHFTPRFATPVVVDNDVNALALAEYRKHPGVQDLLYVKASTGIGAGIVSDGQLRRGTLGAAGEIGHIKVTGAEDLTCRCGDTGCLETLAAGWALVHALSAHGRQLTDTRDVAELVRTGDPEAGRLVRSAGRALGEVLAGAVNLLNPELIVLGGDLAHAYEPLVAGVRESIYQRATAMATQRLRIERSALEEQAGVMASAVMALESVLAPRAVDEVIARRDGELTRSRPRRPE